ncbi:pappalysin-1-like [Littorina saxatilis]|uniref:pappalysin-1-like n=1 Tax=Littorina saxatilis TaxID=31220 RepID=UPI0038B5C08C
MRAVCSPHSPCSPVVAFFCCYLLHTARPSSNTRVQPGDRGQLLSTPLSHRGTTIRPEVSGKSVSSSHSYAATSRTASVPGSYRDKHSEQQVPEYNKEERGSLINAMPPSLDSSHPQLGSGSKSTRTKPTHLSVSADDSHEHDPPPNAVSVSTSDQRRRVTTISADKVHPTDLLTPAADTDTHDLQSRALSLPAGEGSSGPGAAELAEMTATRQTVPASLDHLTSRQQRHYRSVQDDDAKMEAEERWRWGGLLRAKEKVRMTSQQQQQRAGCTHTLFSSTRTVSWVGSLGFSSGEETWCDTDTCDTHLSTATTTDRSMERQSHRPANDDDKPEASQSRAFSRHMRWRRSAVVHVKRATKQLAKKNTQETVGNAEYHMAFAEAVSVPNQSRDTAGRSAHEEPAHDVTQGNDDVVTSHQEKAGNVSPQRHEEQRTALGAGRHDGRPALTPFKHVHPAVSDLTMRRVASRCQSGQCTHSVQPAPVSPASPPAPRPFRWWHPSRFPSPSHPDDLIYPVESGQSPPLRTRPHRSPQGARHHRKGRATSSPTDATTRTEGFGSAVYLSGKEVLTLKPPAVVSPGRSLPSAQFTVEVWVKPEGGQFDPAVLLALSDTCSGHGAGGYWLLGVRTRRGLGDPGDMGALSPTDARYFFSLKTSRSPRETTLTSHRRYQPSQWAHLAATYDGGRMALFVNGALLVVSRGQSREVFPPASAPCMALTLGGLPASSHKFRGSVEELRLWNRALSHADIRRHVTAVMERSVKASLRQAEHGNSSDKASLSPAAQQPGLWSSSSVFRPTLSGQEGGLYLHDPLDSLGQWTLDEDRGATRVVPSDLALPPHDLSLSVPPCGLTVCDNPQVVTAYVTHWQLRSAKQVRYRVFNLMNDDGSDPTVTGERIALQHRSLNDAFRPYNISFLLHVHEVRNSTLRRRLVMFGCERHHIGDGICSPECMHTQTGRDGGDCDVDHVHCDQRKKANGRCDFECNKHYHDWDGGDCCLPGPDTHYTCYDPRSPYSAYVAVEELRELVGLRSDSHLNVFIAVCSDWTAPKMTATHLIGLATFPWEKHVYSVQGGTVIQLQTFGTAGQMDSLVHEVGHNLGLWHVHRGVSEMDCNDPCVETEASLLLGDLCSDTAPTSHNVHCRDPGPAADQCGVTSTFTSTPFTNYMSYADDDCTNHFTPQQGARMHCYLDLAYQPWRTLHKPSPVPLPPRVVAAAKDSVTIAWVTPLGRDAHQPGSVCSLCDAHGALVQFAAFASSPAPASPASHWSPQQATGTPDAEACVPSIRAWLPEVSDCSKKTPCRLDLALHVPVVVHTLTLWVTWNAEGIRRIRLHYDDGTTSVIKATPAFCDLPFTVTLSGPQRLKKVQIYTRTPFTAIDAMRVVSAPQQAQCQACQPVSYRVFRRPAMAGHYFRLTQDTHFTDRDVRNGASYLYWVETLVKRSTSQPSPVLGYTHGQSFCGDGTVNRNEGEECDDGNVRAGDGCDVSCKTEESFRCKSGKNTVTYSQAGLGCTEAASVSLCYRHDGDGVCEDFERQSSVQDCGFFTPPLYVDQWAHLASANPRHQLPSCPARVATGPPPRAQRCGPVVDPRSAWFPCGTQTTTGNFWLELYVPRPVVVTEVIVHVASDGRTDHDPSPKRLKVEVIREDNSTVTLTPRSLTVDCRHPQLHVPVMHDLSTPFYRARGVRVSFRSHNISIAAVRLRSYRHLDPVTLASCGAGEVYNPHTGLCLAPNCTRAPCRPAHVDDGTVVCTGQAEGDVCVVTCKKGYKPEEPSMELTCRGGHWVSARPVSCLPVNCGRPTVRSAVVACQHGTTFGHNCSFRCQPPATLHGSDNWVVCESDGLWSAPRAICLVTCPPPLHVQHVTRVKKRCRSGSLAVGSRCKMRCRKGYHVAGARRTSRRVFRVTCEGDSTWSGPHCQRVTCPKFDPVYTGLLSCTHDVTVSSRCTLTCPGSNEAQLVTCNGNGQWNTPLWPCPQFDRLTCPYPRDVSHLALRCSPPAVGAQCSVTCPTPDEVAVYSDSHTTITASGRRGVQGEVVNSITCTGTGKWFPPLDRVSCIEICSTEYIGDSWCDARNNRKYCQWDGGDCCESTLGSKVEPFPQSCGEDCTCKDPKAAENRGLQAPGSNARPRRTEDEQRGYNDPKAAENRGLQAPGSNARHTQRGYNDPKAAENRGLQAPGSNARHTQGGYNDPKAPENRGLQAPGSNARHTQRGYNDPKAAENRGLQAPGSSARHTQRG